MLSTLPCPHPLLSTPCPSAAVRCAVYSAFYLQQAAALLRPNGTRSLHVGLGIGTAVKAMQRLGVAAGGMHWGVPETVPCRSPCHASSPVSGEGVWVLSPTLALSQLSSPHPTLQTR